MWKKILSGTIAIAAITGVFVCVERHLIEKGLKDSLKNNIDDEDIM